MQHDMDLDATELGAFGALLHALNPFIDDVLRQPEFHCFMDLPSELRLQVYTHYCHNDAKSLICEDWVEADDDAPCFSIDLGGPRTSAPFLPSLCLVSHAIRAETLPVILRTVEYSISSSIEAELFALKIDICPTISLGENVLRLGMMQVSNAEYTKIVARCPNVQVLDIHFSNPRLCRNRRLLLDPYSPDTFLEDFQVQPILESEKLQRVRIHGWADESENIDDARTKLSGITELAHSIKNELESCRYEVQVQLILGSGAWEETTVL